MATLVKARKVINMRDTRYQDSQVIKSGSIKPGCQPQPVCDDSQCLNGCKCSAMGSHCDNSFIPFFGPNCSQPEVGYKFYVERVPGLVTYSYVPSISTSADDISFGFITCKKSGTLAKISGRDNFESIKIYLDDGRIRADTKLGRPSTGSIMSSRKYSNSKLYIVQYRRNGLNVNLIIIDPATGQILEQNSSPIIGTVSQLEGVTKVEVGSEYNQANGQYENPFDGVVIGFKHGGHNIFQLAKNSARGSEVKRPGTSPLTSNPVAAFTCTQEEGVCGPDRPTCMNYGVCMNNRCNCTLTAYAGPTCEEEPEGHYYGWYNFKPGVVIHEYPNSVTTFEDYLAIGLMTYEPDGTIFRVENVDGTQYYDLRLVDGHAQLEYRLADNPKIITEDRMTLNSRDHEYHVIRMNRTRNQITFYVNGYQINMTDNEINNIPFRGQKYLMSGGITKNINNIQILDDWNGILAGLRYNNEYMYWKQFDSSTIIKEGDVEIAGHPFRLKFEPPPTCPVCLNGGVKLPDSHVCDCTYTGFAAPCCEKRDGLFGFHMKKDGNNAVIVYRNDSMYTDLNSHKLSVSFRTANGWEDGEIIRVQTEDGQQFILVELVNNRLRFRYQLCGQRREEIFQGVDVRQQADHKVTVSRNRKLGYVELDGTTRGIEFPDCDFNPSLVYTGGSWNGSHVTSGHYGIIWGAVYNGNDIVEITRNPGAVAKGIIVHAPGGDSWDIIPYPWPPLCDKGDVGCGATMVSDSPAGGAGATLSKIGPAVIVPGGIKTPPLVPVNTGAIIAAIMGGLLFSSAIAFAAVGMKPGFFALSKGGFGGGTAYVPVADGPPAGAFPTSNGNYAMGVGIDSYTAGGGGGGGGSQVGSRLSHYEESMESRFDATDGGMAAGTMNGGAVMNGGGGGGGYNAYNQSSSWYTRNETLQNEAMGYGAGGGSTIGGYGRGAGGYPGSVAGGSVSGSVYGFGTVTNPDQAFITLSEDIAVDNVVLTADGRYVVTGSNLGPPQVWNTNVSCPVIPIFSLI